MKKWIAALLAVLVMVSLLAGCANKTEEKQDNTTKGTEAPKETESKETEPEGTKPEGTEPEGTQGDEKVEAPVLEGVMSYAEYAAAELETEVTVACCVQATQSWWDNKITDTLLTKTVLTSCMRWLAPRKMLQSWFPAL